MKRDDTARTRSDSALSCHEATHERTSGDGAAGGGRCGGGVVPASAGGRRIPPGGLFCRDVHLLRVHADGREQPVLAGVDAEFPCGCCSLVIGATGAGKSTLLQVLGGLLRPTAGEVWAAGEPVSRFTVEHRDRWRQRVGIGFQRPELWPELTALENVMVPLVPRGYPLHEIRRRGRAALARVNALSAAYRPTGALSVGEQQRVALARALVSDPVHLVADEPTAHQDDEGVDCIGRLLEEQAQRGTTVVVASHDPRLQRHPAFARRWHLIEGKLLPVAQSTGQPSAATKGRGRL
ncbi:ABC transporter ATP-binding protein [Myxococcota bacterium]